MKRSREVIIAEILEICSDGATKTRVVYQANLNFRTVVPYLDLLTNRELLVRSKDDSVIFKTTSKGIKLLKELKTIQGELKEISSMADSDKGSGLALG